MVRVTVAKHDASGLEIVPVGCRTAWRMTRPGAYARLAATVELAPLAADLDRVETDAAAASVAPPIRFLGEVASHLVDGRRQAAPARPSPSAPAYAAARCRGPASRRRRSPARSPSSSSTSGRSTTTT